MKTPEKIVASQGVSRPLLVYGASGASQKIDRRSRKFLSANKAIGRCCNIQ